jgi:hypothetical protein
VLIDPSSTCSLCVLSYNNRQYGIDQAKTCMTLLLSTFFVVRYSVLYILFVTSVLTRTALIIMNIFIVPFYNFSETLHSKSPLISVIWCGLKKNNGVSRLEKTCDPLDGIQQRCNYPAFLLAGISSVRYGTQAA